MSDDKLLLEARPSWWNFFWHFFFFWLIIPPIIALVEHAALVLRVYENRVVLEKGLLSKRVNEIFISDIRTVDTRQGITQRIFNIGNIMFGTAGTSGYESVAHGIHDPRSIRDLVMKQRQSIKGSNE